MKVMLVDDDDLVRSTLVEVLEDAGFQVMDFADPREALGTFGAVGRSMSLSLTSTCVPR